MTDPIVKKRRVAIDNLKKEANIDWIKERLMKKDGMMSINVDIRKDVVRMTYDLRKIKFEAIEKSIIELGLELSQKFLEKCKRGMAKFTEQNELDNQNAPMSSCCDDPKENIRDCKTCVTQGKNF